MRPIKDNEVLGETICLGATFTTTNNICTSPRSNLGLRSKPSLLPLERPTSDERHSETGFTLSTQHHSTNAPY